MDDLATAIAEGAEHRARCGRCSTPSCAAARASWPASARATSSPSSSPSARADGALRAVAPVAPALRADPDAVNERTWLLVAALVGALVEVGRRGQRCARATSAATSRSTSPATPTTPSSCRWPSRATSRAIDRLRARALALPARRARRRRGPARPDRRRAPAAWSPPASPRLGGRPADPASMEEHEDAVLAALEARRAGVSRPHDDPDPARRVARRILQRLDGMGKWGGYHTEFAHLARGFAGNDRALADDGGRGAARRRPAGREAERGPAPRVPQPAPGRRHPRADRARRGARAI